MPDWITNEMKEERMEKEPRKNRKSPGWKMKVDLRLVKELLKDIDTNSPNKNWYSYRQNDLVIYWKNKHYYIAPSTMVEKAYSLNYYVPELGSGYEETYYRFVDIIASIRRDTTHWEP